MSKAEEFAYSKYPKDKKGVLYNIARNSIIEGYHQAEKDLELTCDDIKIIVNAFLDFDIESVKSRETKKYTDEEYCIEILERFNKERKEK